MTPTQQPGAGAEEALAEAPPIPVNDIGQPSDADAAPPDRPRPPVDEVAPRRALPILPTVLGLLLLAAIVVAVLLWQRGEDALDARDDLRSAEADATEARSVAAEVGEALLTYDFDDLEESRSRVLARATDDFAQIYDDAFEVGLQPTISELQASSKGTVQDVFLSEVDDDAATAIVVVDAQSESTAGTRRLIGSYLQMELVREHGDWLVDQVFAIAAVDESLEAADPPASTTTTAAPGG